MTTTPVTPLLALGWRPLLDPLPLDGYYLLFLVPLVVAIAVVYKAIKVEDLTRLPRAAAVLAVQILVFMVLAAAVLWMVTELT